MVCEHFPTGGSRNVQALARALGRKGHEVMVASTSVGLMGEKIESASTDYYQVVRFPSVKMPWLPYIYTPRAEHRLSRLAQRFQPDVVHSHFIMYWLPLASQAITKSGIPLVITAHGFTLPENLEHLPLRLALRMNYLTLGQKLLSKSSEVICVSSHTRDCLVSFFPDTIGLIHVIPNGIDPAIERARLSKSRNEMREELGVEDCLVFLYVGRMTRAKGVTQLVSAFVNGFRSEQKVALIVVGSGPELGRLRAGYSGNPKVKILGFQEDVGSFYAASDVMVLPSTREGMPTVLLEAMHYGLPILTTEVGGVEELVSMGVQARILKNPTVNDIKAGLVHFVEMDETQRRSIGKRNAEVVRTKFSWMKLADETLKVYNKSLGLV